VLDEVLLDADALGLEAHAEEVFQAVLHLLVDERLGHLVDQLGQGVGGLLLHRHGWPATA
jgi:hypothetical protein